EPQPNDRGVATFLVHVTTRDSTGSAPGSGTLEEAHSCFESRTQQCVGAYHFASFLSPKSQSNDSSRPTSGANLREHQRTHGASHFVHRRVSRGGALAPTRPEN